MTTQADGADEVFVAATVTWDLFDDERVSGGAASFIARLCEGFGMRARMLVAAGADADMAALGGHDVQVVRSATQTYRHLVEDGRRRLDLEQGLGRTLTAADVPAEWPEPKVVLLAPLQPEDMDVADFLDEWPGATVGLLAQGLQRIVLPGSKQTANRAQPSAVLLDAARPHVSIFLSEDEVRLWASGAIAHLAARAARVVVTEGARGATVYDHRGATRIPPVPAAVVDTTGAGDTFAAAYILGLRAGEQHAGRLAAAYAAAAVEVRGPAPLPPRSVIEARLSGGEAAGAGPGDVTDVASGETPADGGASA